MAGPRRLTGLVSSALERLALPEGELVVALSGGADSAALAYLTLEAGRRARMIHVDHGLRHSPMMRRAAAEVAAGLDLDLEEVEVVVGEGASPEDQARQARYQALAEASTEDERVLTGHTTDDSVETVLINLIRGTGPAGLAGIPYHRPPNVYRPMLGIARSETREIAAIAGLPFVDDPMNQDPTLTRNQVRHVILPALEEINPSVSAAVTRMSRSIAEDQALLGSGARLLHPRLGAGSSAIAVGSLMAAPRPLADRVLRLMAAHVAGEERVDAAGIERIWSVVEGGSGSQEIGSGAVASLSGPMLVLSAGARADAGPDQVDLTPGRVLMGDMVFETTVRSGPCRVAPLDKWSALFPRPTKLAVSAEGLVMADGEPAWVPGEKRLPVAWYQPGDSGYLVVSATRRAGWTSSR